MSERWLQLGMLLGWVFLSPVFAAVDAAERLLGKVTRHFRA